MLIPVASVGDNALFGRLGVYIILAAVLQLAAMPESYGRDDGEWTPSTVRSPSRRFFVSADDPGDRLLLSRWADDVYLRFRKVWRPAVELPAERVFDIIVDAEGEKGVPGAIQFRRNIRGNRVNLGLRIERVSTLDGEQFIEAVCAMILDALIIEAQPEEDRTFYEENAPHWLSVGVAQNLYPSLRTRNQQLVVDLWRSGDLPGMDEILTWRHLPPYRGFKHAVSSVWVAWAAADNWSQPSDALLSWIAFLAEGWPITPARLNPEASAPNTGEGWEPYVASLQRLFTAGDTIGAVERYGRLRQALQVLPGVSGIPSNLEMSEEEYGLDVLISWRREPWIEIFSHSRQNELSALAAGGPSDYQALIGRAVAFIHSLDSRRPRFLLRRDYRRILNDLEEQETLAALREQYVGLFEARHQLYHPPAWLEDDGLDAPPPSRLRRYVDEFDKP